MSVLVDTNVLSRRMQPEHPSHHAAVLSVARLLANGEQPCVAAQNIAEFWNVATRPIANNGLGFSVGLAQREVERIEAVLPVLPDASGTYAEWKRLVIRHGVVGSKVHDTRLVAMMKLHGIRRILTFNVSDFARYDVEALHPDTVAPTPTQP
jgi:predicted nucleic acid-binding protein